MSFVVSHRTQHDARQIWDVLSDQEAVDALLKPEHAKLDAKTLAHLLVHTALTRDSGDNLTAMVVKL